MRRNVRKTTQIAILALLGAVFVVSVTPTGASAAGSTIYVDGANASCSDANTGDVAHPLCTISKAASIATAGQTVVVNPGTYSESVTVAHSGSSGSPIVFIASGAVVVSGGTHGFTVSAKGYVTISGFSVTQTTSYGIYVTGSDHITISGNHVTNAGLPQQSKTAMGIYVNNTTASVVSGNISNDNSDVGIDVVGTSTGVTVSGNQTFNNAQGWQRAATGINIQGPGNTVVGNISHDNEDTGIQIYPGPNGTPGANDTLVVNNFVYNNGDHGIDNLNVTGGKLIGNTVYHNCASGINVEGTSSSYVVENNVAVDNAVFPAYQGIACARGTGNIRIWDSAATGTTADYNLVWLTTAGTEYGWKPTSYSTLAAMRAATGQEAHGIQADPKFVNPAGWDVHLGAGSPAIDSADSSAPGQQASDFEGTPRLDDSATANTGAGPRAYDDRGAYEFSGPTTVDQPPVAALNVTPSSGSAPLFVTANASASTDTDPTPIVSYTFNFGDGTPVVGPQAIATAVHTFQQPGIYTVKVTVKDTANLSSTATATVTVSSANLVGNPGFETNTNRWAPFPATGLLFFPSGITLTRVAGGHSGTSAVLVKNTANKQQQCGLDDSPNWVKTTSAGFYTAQIWVRADQPGTSFSLVLTENSGSRNVGSASKSVTLTTSWQLVTVTYTIMKPGSTLDFNGSTTQKSGNCFYGDDISITFV